MKYSIKPQFDKFKFNYNKPIILLQKSCKKLSFVKKTLSILKYYKSKKW